MFRIIPDDVDIKFTKCKSFATTISIIFVVCSILIILLRGLNIGIDFSGGVLVEIGHSEKESVILDTLKSNGFVVHGSRSGNNFAMRFKGDGGENEIKKIKDVLNENFDNLVYHKLDYVGPQVSSQHMFDGILSMVIAIIGIFFYICFRFNWRFGLSGTIALIHDVIVTMGFISFMSIEIAVPSIAALLTVIGYSINDSVVIYDRIREYTSFNKGVDNIIDKSINSTLSRTVLTSGTTLLATVPLMLFCTGAVKDFSLIIFFGVFIGTYSSIFISAVYVKQ